MILRQWCACRSGFSFCRLIKLTEHVTAHMRHKNGFSNLVWMGQRSYELTLLGLSSINFLTVQGGLIVKVTGYNSVHWLPVCSYLLCTKLSSPPDISSTQIFQCTTILISLEQEIIRFDEYASHSGPLPSAPKTKQTVSITVHSIQHVHDSHTN